MASKIDDIVSKIQALPRQESIERNDITFDFYTTLCSESNKLLVFVRYDKNISNIQGLVTYYTNQLQSILDELDIIIDTEVEVTDNSRHEYYRVLHKYSEYTLSTSICGIEDEVQIPDEVDYIN